MRFHCIGGRAALEVVVARMWLKRTWAEPKPPWVVVWCAARHSTQIETGEATKPHAMQYIHSKVSVIIQQHCSSPETGSGGADPSHIEYNRCHSVPALIGRHGTPLN